MIGNAQTARHVDTEITNDIQAVLLDGSAEDEGQAHDLLQSLSMSSPYQVGDDDM